MVTGHWDDDYKVSIFICLNVHASYLGVNLPCYARATHGFSRFIIDHIALDDDTFEWPFYHVTKLFTLWITRRNRHYRSGQY